MSLNQQLIMGLAVIEKAIEDLSGYRTPEFIDTVSPEIKGIFKKIRQYLKPGQEIVLYLTDASYPDQEMHVLRKEGVTIFNTRTQEKLGTCTWGMYLKLLPLFPVEVKPAVEELKKLKDTNTRLYQSIQ